MSKLAKIELEDGNVIYMETGEGEDAPFADGAGKTDDEEEVLVSKGGNKRDTVDTDAVVQKFKAIEATIRAYTAQTLNAFKDIAANVDKITLEFGIEVGGEAGIPYVTKGTAKSNMKITVECSFPK